MPLYLTFRTHNKAKEKRPFSSLFILSANILSTEPTKRPSAPHLRPCSPNIKPNLPPN